MDSFFKWLSTNTAVAIFVSISFGVLLISITVIYLIAFVQGRKITFWPPGIGERPQSQLTLPDKNPVNKNVDDLTRRERSLDTPSFSSPGKKFGIVDLYNMQDQSQQHKRNYDTRQLILQGNTFHLLALSAVSYVDPAIKRHWDHLRSKLQEGNSFYILIMDPFHDEKRHRDQLNNISSSFDPKFRLDLLINLYNHYPSVNIRLATQNIYCSLFFSEKDMMYDPYHLGKVGDRLENNFLALRIKRNNNPNNYYYILQKHFEYLWSQSEEFESYVEQHKEKLALSYETTNLRSRVKT